MKVLSVLLFASVVIDAVAGLLGGTIVKSGTKRYVAGLRQTNDPNSLDYFTFCGGVLITPTHVLTSAACTYLFPTNYVAIGAHSLGTKGDGVEIKVVKVTTHPQFNPNITGYDIAVLELDGFTTIEPIKLPTPTDVRTGMWIAAMGWGVTGPEGKASPELRRLSQQVVTNDACRKALDFDIQQDQLCAGGEENKSTCTGDTGGPAILEHNTASDSDDVLIGLVSGGRGCGVKGLPTVYTRVPNLLDWIKQQTVMDIRTYNEAMASPQAYKWKEYHVSINRMKTHRFTMNLFRELKLPTDARAKLVEITDASRYFGKFEEYEEQSAKCKRVDLLRWKKMDKSGHLTSYMERKGFSIPTPSYQTC
ncbi:hypothetical protein PsorP6_015740 [Peronosclerospora sorghi]|uniref:Uncharacterized protein n=1 Tax=Peronosclerospora sorghi TaxID=230839 RepID=A0ACC0WQY0_9STRA|nr:hypothetical protein PsorP6_015740 [Peronosclerospora sorghi]